MKKLSKSSNLDRALGLARRSACSARLSDGARAEILDAALAAPQARLAPLPRLFAPARRLLVAGALPVLLAAVFVGTLNRSVQPDPAGSARVAVSKQGDQITFTIANGGKPHTIYRSTSPSSFDPAQAVRVDGGEFVDRVDDQASIVFYRFD